MTDDYKLINGDNITEMPKVEDQSIGLYVFSPPFADLYVYSDDPRDMGNCTSDKEFQDHLSYLIPLLLQKIKPGRIAAVHCMDMPMMKQRHGNIGIRDFPGDLVRAFSAAGWIYHSRVTIWKDPVVAMQRTKALGLLHKQIKKDATRCRQGLADYVLAFRAPGDNLEPVVNTPETFPVGMWQRIASPIWMDINQTDVLPYRGARAEKDERHICPLQLEVIRRAVLLWSNPGDLVCDPFAGVGSTGYIALETSREFLGIELKESYFNQAKMNLDAADRKRNQTTMFSLLSR